MLRLWSRVCDYKADPMNGGGEWRIDDGALRLCLDYGHECIDPDDDFSETYDALITIRDVRNSNPDLWPEMMNG